ncbi:origin recognition complex subunit 4 [Rhodotorula paludigena]|uniref:origin recognition complex subunit 4 n=1 Tax=Rhodotorula paludigena TaxID=86838 RepID=UPI00316D9A23
MFASTLRGRQTPKKTKSLVRGTPITPSDPDNRPVRSPSPPVTADEPADLAPPSPAPTPSPRKSPLMARKRLVKESTSARSTRSSGTADYFQPIDGAPEPNRKAASRKPARTRYHDSDDSSSGEEVIVKPSRRAAPSKQAVTPSKKRAPARGKSQGKARQLPSPSPEVKDEDEDDEDEDEVEQMLVPSKPPARQRAKRVADISTAPDTPSKKRAAPPAVSSPVVLTPSAKRVRREVSAMVDDEADEPPEADASMQEDVFGPVASSSTPSKASTSSTRLTTPSRSSSSTKVTPSRSSSRIQRLPANQEEIANAPASLRSRLVGFHMDDEGYGERVVEELRGEQEEQEMSEEVDVEADEAELARRRAAKGKGKARMMEEDEEVDMAHEADEAPLHAFSLEQQVPPPTTSTAPLLAASNDSYLKSPIHAHLSSALGILSGARLPRPRLAPTATSTLPPRDAGLLKLSYLEGGYDEWERPLRSALDECVTKGMGNAVMLLGPRGVGKTMIVERTLALLSHVHGSSAFVTVRLSGLVHTTDRLALRSIAVQLQEQGFGTSELVADEGDYSSNSATMSTLLRLLEPSSASTASSASTSASSSSASTKPKGTPLVLIVDEFDLFAQHPRQSFLYCLLDIVQGNRRSGGFAVVGVSARVDCLSLLEKRVRSRCQSHVLQMIPPSNFTAFCDLAKRLLGADPRAWELERGEEGREWAESWNEEVERFVQEKKIVDYLDRLWSIHGNVPTELRAALAHLCYRLDHHGRLHGFEEVPRLRLDMLKPQPRGEDKVRDDVLKHLSIPELTVLIGCKHLSTSTLDRQAGFNFEMVFDAYLSHAKRVSASTTASSSGGAVSLSAFKPLSKAALRSAFDALRAHEILLPRTSSGSASAATAAVGAGAGLPVSVPGTAYQAPTQRDPWRMVRMTVWAKDVDREVEARGGECPLALRRWCKNWLD